MSSTEDYLDRLLRGVTGEAEPEPEPEVMAESETIPEEILENVDYKKILDDLPLIDEMPTETASIEDLIPKQIISEVPVLADDAAPFEVPVYTDQNITIDNNEVFEETLVTEPFPTVDETPVINEIPVSDDSPITEEISVVMEKEAEEPIFADDATPYESAVLLDEVMPDFDLPGEELPADGSSVEDILSDVMPSGDILFNDTLQDTSITGDIDLSDTSVSEGEIADLINPEELPLEDINLEEVTPEEINLEETTPEGINLEEITPEGINLEDITSEGIILEDITPEEITLEEIGLEEINPEDITPSEITPEEISLEEINPEDFTPSEIDSEEINLENITPEETYSEFDNSEELNLEGLNLEELNPEEVNFEENNSEEENSEGSTDLGLEEFNFDDLAGLNDLGGDFDSDINGELGADISADPVLTEDVGLELDDGISANLSNENLEDDEIANLLMDIENMGREDAMKDLMSSPADESLDSLLLGSDDADMSEIGDILAKDENSELLDMFSSDSASDLEDDFMPDMFMSEDGEFDEESDKKKKKKEKKPKKEKKAKKAKKEKVKEEADEAEGEKKPGFLQKLAEIFLASDDDDELEDINKFEESALDIAVEGAADNEAILAELDEEEDSKGKKGKKKKGKLSDKEKAELKAEKKRLKEEKKRLKAEQKALEDAKPKKKLPKKKVIPVCILFFSLGVVITLLAFVMPSLLDKKKAVKLYQQHNYESTYMLLKGHSLSKSEKLMYDRTVTLLQEERKLDSYHNYMLLDMRPEALNALVQGVKKHDEVSGRAAELEVTDELNSIYSEIVSELQNTFGLSVDKVSQWLNITDPEEYSYIVNSYANGKGESLIDSMETEQGALQDTIDSNTIDVWSDSVISAEEAEIQ